MPHISVAIDAGYQRCGATRSLAELDVYLKSDDLFKDDHYTDVAFQQLEWPPSGAVGDAHPPV